jgi:hypothetical protein
VVQGVDPEFKPQYQKKKKKKEVHIPVFTLLSTLFSLAMCVMPLIQSVSQILIFTQGLTNDIKILYNPGSENICLLLLLRVKLALRANLFATLYIYFHLWENKSLKNPSEKS